MVYFVEVCVPICRLLGVRLNIEVSVHRWGFNCSFRTEAELLFKGQLKCCFEEGAEIPRLAQEAPLDSRLALLCGSTLSSLALPVLLGGLNCEHASRCFTSYQFI